MRIVQGVFIAALMLVATALSTGGVTAKTYISLTPNSGPAGSTVQVAASGFAEGDIRIALAPLDLVDSGSVEELPEEGIVTLAQIAAVKHKEERIAVVLPGPEDFAWGKQVDILAIQRDAPTSNARFFVAKARFDVTAASGLPSAGVGPAGEIPDGRFWPVAALVLGGALLASVGLRLRVVARLS